MIISRLLFLLVSLTYGQSDGGSKHHVKNAGLTTGNQQYTNLDNHMSLRGLQQVAGKAPRISGGVDAPDGRFPYMLSVRDATGVHRCGAVLIHPFFCLTAAHCVHPKSQESIGPNPIVLAGVFDRKDHESTAGVQAVKVQRTFIHPDYNVTNISDGGDIALLQLLEPLSQAPIPLPDPENVPKTWQRLLALGWGIGSHSTKLQQAFLHAISVDDCYEAWKDDGVALENFETTLICAFNSRADTCKGDSGGPLLIPYMRQGNVSAGEANLDTLMALTSFGPVDCTKHEIPGVYTLVGPYVPWIQNLISQESREKPAAKGCDSKAVQPRAPLTISSFSFASILGKLQIPEACKSFRIKDLEQCLPEFGVGRGCCSPECENVFEKVSSQCWAGIQQSICTQDSDQPALLLDLLSRRCDSKSRTVACKNVPLPGVPSPLTAATIVPPPVPSLAPALAERCTEADSCSQLGQELLVAAEQGNVAAVQELVAKGAPLDARDSDGETPLHKAAEQGHLDVVLHLLSSGAPVDPKDNIGETPLIEAVAWGYVDVVKALLSYGASTTAMTSNGYTAVDWAKDPDIQEALRSAGSRTMDIGK